MNEANVDQTLVVTDVRDEDGTRWRAVTLHADGGLSIIGHDLGPGVERFFGCREYEFERTLSAGEVSALRELLELGDEADLLAAIAERFASTHELESFAEQHDITGTFWSRSGD